MGRTLMGRGLRPRGHNLFARAWLAGGARARAAPGRAAGAAAGGAEDAPPAGGVDVHECPSAEPPRIPWPAGRDRTASAAPSSRPETHRVPPAPVLLFTDAGEIALADPSTGAVLAAAPGAGLEGVRDVSFDPWGSRAVVYEGDLSDEYGEIATYPLGAGGLGARAHRAWVDGDARVLAAPAGIVVFEESYGARWKLLGPGDGPALSVVAPRPASVWGEPEGDGLRVHALTYGDPWDDTGLDRREALVTPAGIPVPEVHPLDLAPASSPPTTRLARCAELGGAVLVDVAEGAIVVALAGSAGVGPAWPIPLGSPVARIEHALVLPGTTVLVALASAPSRLVAAELGPDGAPLAAAAIDLPGDVRVEDRFASRDLLAVGPGRVLAATAQGVLAVAVTREAGEVVLAPDEAFAGAALRGPLEGPVTIP